jgi:hypothetical protein
MADERWQQLKSLLQEAVKDYIGRVEYGNLRLEVYDAESGAADGVAADTGTADSGTADSNKVAMAFEVPGGSTSQFAVSYEGGSFHMLDAGAEEVLNLDDPREVVARVRQQIGHIPAYRDGRLRGDIDQLIAGGASRRAIFEELNRLLRLGTEFRGGSLTVDELTAACRYTVSRFGGSES